MNWKYHGGGASRVGRDATAKVKPGSIYHDDVKHLSYSRPPPHWHRPVRGPVLPADLRRAGIRLLPLRDPAGEEREPAAVGGSGRRRFEQGIRAVPLLAYLDRG